MNICVMRCVVVNMKWIIIFYSTAIVLHEIRKQMIIMKKFKIQNNLLFVYLFLPVDGIRNSFDVDVVVAAVVAIIPVSVWFWMLLSLAHDNKLKIDDKTMTIYMHTFTAFKFILIVSIIIYSIWLFVYNSIH